MRRLALALPLVTACAFDSSGAGTSASAGLTSVGTGGTGSDTEGTGSTTTGIGTSSTSSTSKGNGATSSTSTSTSSSTSSTSSSSSSSSGGDDTGGPWDCTDPPGVILWAEDADSVVPPMNLAASQMLPPCGAYDPIRYAWSPEADAGRITWSFEALDDLQADIYALVYDDLPGLQNLDPDSYWLSLDGGPEMRWAYGCYTASWPEARWGWVPLLPLVSGNCSADAPTYDVPAGVHTISLRNSEPEQQGRIASIAAIYIAPTPAPDPYQVYDPYP